ncbi:MAG: hypothetical protein RL260_3887, partial [Pseudomonadota bacterium]
SGASTLRWFGPAWDEPICRIQAPSETPIGEICPKCTQPIRAQLHYLVQTHLRLFLVQGTGLCALVLSEGRSKGQELGESFLPLQRRYTAPLMDLLARGQASGEIRRDVSLRLLRSVVLGPMEHILWEVVAQAKDKPTDIDAVATDLVALLWSAVQAPRP